ncbi:MAG: hypothetical protein QOD71_3066 [Thermoleophilaceae bacterium]|nr:hypothetical protein [Thermoleophilaceae bacterium]
MYVFDASNPICYKRALSGVGRTAVPVAERRIKAQKELSHQLEKYPGKWVAVKDDTIVAVADTPKELLERSGGQEIDRRFRVPARSGATLL